MNQILVVEDEVVIRAALRRLLERHEYRVCEAGSVKESLEKYDVDSFDVIISDLRLPGASGTDLIKATSTPVLIMTSYSSIKSAINSMKMGAVDYIAKPFEHNEIIEAVAKIIRENPSQRQAGAAESEDEGAPITGMIGSCPQMHELFRRIRKVAQTNSTVLINGESGTGKELVARGIHDLSNREGQEMISVNCAAIPENLIESELFGHEKGAFTGATATRTGLVEAANGGTLFLDEIGELPLEAQARLLRVLQENEIRKVGSVQSKRLMCVSSQQHTQRSQAARRRRTVQGRSLLSNKCHDLADSSFERTRKRCPTTRRCDPATNMPPTEGADHGIQ